MAVPLYFNSMIPAGLKKRRPLLIGRRRKPGASTGKEAGKGVPTRAFKSRG